MLIANMVESIKGNDGFVAVCYLELFYQVMFSSMSVHFLIESSDRIKPFVYRLHAQMHSSLGPLSNQLFCQNCFNPFLPSVEYYLSCWEVKGH